MNKNHGKATGQVHGSGSVNGGVAVIAEQKHGNGGVAAIAEQKHGNGGVAAIAEQKHGNGGIAAIAEQKHGNGGVAAATEQKQRIGNVTELKQGNGAALLEALFYRSVSRAELARVSGLTRSAVSDHIDEMIMKGLICEIGAGEAERGRKPVLLDIDPTYGYYGGFYLSRSICRVGITDIKGNVLAGASLDAEMHSQPDDVIVQASAKLLGMLRDSGIPADKLIGVGASVPGPLDTKTGDIMMPPGFSLWHRYPLKKNLAEHIRRPVYAENNAASLTLAEIRFGYGRDHDSFIFILVDSGIGGGIVVNRRRLVGVGGYGSELGHTSIRQHGRMCACGNQGCLERYAAIPILLNDCFSPDEGVTTWKQVVDGAEKGDARCMEAMGREADHLAVTLVNFVNALEPQAIVFTGQIGYRPELFTRMLKERVCSSVIMRDIRQVEVLPSPLSVEYEILAAASIAIDAFITGA